MTLQSMLDKFTSGLEQDIYKFILTRKTGTQDGFLLGLELAIDPLHPLGGGGNSVHYDFLKLNYIRHKIKMLAI